MNKALRLAVPAVVVVILCCCGPQASSRDTDVPLIQISENRRFLSLSDGGPSFWLGDTAWSLFRKLTREEAESYLENRRQKGFNVIQAVAVFNVRTTNAYGDSALVNGQVTTPLVTPGSDPADSAQYDYYQRTPVKPTLDGEPSYEGIPQGLHDTTQPYWTDDDVRRYAYWSVFAGACGFTYGHNAVMQFYRPVDQRSAYGPREYWTTALDSPGAGQMTHLARLMLSRPYFERVPDQSLIAANQDERYDYLIATRGQRYAFVYTYTGRNMEIAMGRIAGSQVRASWFEPRTGAATELGASRNEVGRVLTFDPPGEKQDGNDWVLVLDGV